VETVKKDHISALLQEVYFPDDAPKFLARQTGIKVLKLSPSCPDVKPGSYFAHFDELAAALGGN